MALIRSNDIPKDAVQLNEEEASNYIWDTISKWEPVTEVWALRYSIGVLGGINAATGVFINHFFRKKLKLGRYGHLSSLIPNTFLPGVFTAAFHRYLVSTDILLMKRETCPICYELKSAVIQLGYGIVYPMILAPASALMLANRYNTYRLPSLVEKPKELLKLTLKLAKPLSGPLAFAASVQLIASSVFTYYELKNHLTMRLRLLEVERRMDASS